MAELTAEGVEVSKPSENVDTEKEKRAHEFRTAKRINSPFAKAAFAVIRDDESIWGKVSPDFENQKQLERNTTLPGELHRVSAALTANIYREPEAAALYDVALYDTTLAESDFFREKIENGVNYSPITIVGIGGVYGTILSAAFLKANPNNPAFGFDSAKRRGGIWAISGDVTLDKPFWRMNSRNRPEDRNKLPLPGTDGNLNSLGAETQNLQVPDISSAQYPTNNEMGRVLTHDGFITSNGIFNAELVKIRPNLVPDQMGFFEEEYQDRVTGQRFYHYTDVNLQASGLGKESLGFSNKFSATQSVLDQAEQDLREGIVTPRVLTFFQLVEAATSNRRDLKEDFEKFGLEGKGDTSKVVREYFLAIGGIDPGVAAQSGFVKEITVFGLGDQTAEDLAKTERARYYLGLLEVGRERGGFFRVEGQEGRVVGVGDPKGSEGLIVYIKRTDETPEGTVVTYGTRIVPRLVTAAGFDDESDKIYSGLTAEIITNKREIMFRVDDGLKKTGSTIFYSDNSRLDIDIVTTDGRFIQATLVNREGNTTKKRFDREEMSDEDLVLFSPVNVDRLEIAGESPKFEPFYDEEYDNEIPVAEKAVGFEIYKIGACTNLPLLEKEKKQTKAYEQIPENTKSVFRFVRRSVAFAKKLAQNVKPVEGAVNLEVYKPEVVELSGGDTNKRDLVTVPIDPKAAVQELSPNLKADNLLKYLVVSRLNCVFPQGFNELSFGVKRSGDNFKFQFNQGIPGSEDWQVIDRFLADPLLQRVLIQLTNKSTGAGEVSIGITNQRVNIRRINGRSIRNDETSEFNQKYNQLV